jgi:hypothetical protein
LTASWALGHRRDDGITGLGRMMVLRAKGRRGSTVSWARGGRRCHRPRDGAVRWRHGLGEDDVVVGPVTVKVR